MIFLHIFKKVKTKSQRDLITSPIQSPFRFQSLYPVLTLMVQSQTSTPVACNLRAQIVTNISGPKLYLALVITYNFYLGSVLNSHIHGLDQIGSG